MPVRPFTLSVLRRMTIEMAALDKMARSKGMLVAITGLMLGFMAQGYAPEIASLISVYVHGVAGELASEEHGIHGVTAGDVAQNVGRAIKQILTV